MYWKSTSYMFLILIVSEREIQIKKAKIRQKERVEQFLKGVPNEEYYFNREGSFYLQEFIIVSAIF
jgi:hypothetical protein